MYMRAHPFGRNHRCTREEYERKALAQGLVAINSILRDWVKGQVTAVECGILDFATVFMPYMLTDDGRTVIERIAEMGVLPPPRDDPRLPPPPPGVSP
jgi:hypothetical protein